MSTRQEPGLDLGEDEAFRRRFYKAQQSVWIVMILFLLAGMLGLLGGAGPLVYDVAGTNANGLTVDYPRFLRNRAPIDLVLHVEAASTTSGRISIDIERAYIERFDIQFINPEPAEVQAGARSMTYAFDLADQGQATSITFSMQPERFGYVVGHIGLDEKPEVEFWQVIYP
jgi:hypothetical protein